MRVGGAIFQLGLERVIFDSGKLVVYNSASLRFTSRSGCLGYGTNFGEDFAAPFPYGFFSDSNKIQEIMAAAEKYQEEAEKVRFKSPIEAVSKFIGLVSFLYSKCAGMIRL